VGVFLDRAPGQLAGRPDRRRLCWARREDCQTDARRSHDAKGEASREAGPEGTVMDNSKRACLDGRPLQRRAAESAQERGSIRGALSRVLGERGVCERPEAGRNVGASSPDRRGPLCEVPLRELGHRSTFERKHARQHPEEQHAERIDVARGLRRLARHLLGGDVGSRPDDHSRLRRRLTACSRDPEVRQFRPALTVEDNIRRLQVAMDDSISVRVRETGRDVERDAGGRIVA
jgi:hypothetical protein